MAEWFERWFGEEYLRLYPHRDDADAAGAVALVDHVVPVADRRVLDLACGPGRHADPLRRRGARVVGIDLSMPLLNRARARLGVPAHLARGDMRALPFAPASFDIVVNLFTSFGYFDDDGQHAAVLLEVARVLRRGGTFVLDFFNAACVVAGLVPREERTIAGQRVEIERRISDDGRFVLKEMRIAGHPDAFHERVRLFDRGALVAMLEQAGLHVRDAFGGYDGSPATNGAPRLVLAADRA